MSGSTPIDRQALLADLFERYDALALGAFRDIRAEAKADGTAVTRVDREASRMVVEALKAHSPDYGIVSEEEAEAYQPHAANQWVIDPLDGTASFARGYPVWGLGIGLLQGRQPSEGYLRFPVLDETYTFSDGELRFNGKPVQPPDPDPLRDTRNLLLDSSLHKQRFTSFEPLGDFKLRVFGSNLYHMICVAMGRAEAMVCGRVYLWDLAAGLPITRARGFTERFADGSPFDLDEVIHARPMRLRGPLLIGPAQRIDEIVSAISPVLREPVSPQAR